MKTIVLFLFTYLFLSGDIALAGPWPCDYSGPDTMNCYAHKEATNPKEFTGVVTIDKGLSVTADPSSSGNDGIDASAVSGGSGYGVWGHANGTAGTAGVYGLYNGIDPAGAAVIADSGSGGINLGLSNGSNVLGLNVSPTLTSYNIIWPDSQGSGGLTNDGSGVLSWVPYLPNPMTTTGDIIYSADNSGDPQRLGIGGANTVVHGGSTPSYSAVVDADFSGQLSTAKGGTGQNSSATFPTSGVVVTTAASQTLSSKTLVSPTIEDSSIGPNTLTYDFSLLSNPISHVFQFTGTGGNITFPQGGMTLLGNTTTQNVFNKTLDNTNQATLKDTKFTLQDDGDTTKKAVFQLSGITTGTTRTFTVPDASTTIVGTDTAQTLTNKSIGSTNSLTGANMALFTPDSGTHTLTAPLATDTLVGKATTDTLTNKSIAASEINSGTLAVVQGGTNLASGTSGGILGYTASGTLASSAALTANGVVLGGGAGATPTSTAAGTNGQLLIGNTSAAPTWGNTVSSATTFSGGYSGNTAFIYTFANLTGVSTVVNFTDGVVQAGGAGVTKTISSPCNSSACTVTLTFANTGLFRIGIEFSSTWVSGIATDSARMVATLGGTSARLNASHYVGSADDKIQFNTYDNNADPATFNDSFFISVSSANQTITISATLERDLGVSGTVTGGLLLSAQAI